MIKGSGVDIIDIPRIQKMLDKDSRFTEKIFTENENRYCKSKASKSMHYAARFAAKEAFFKALGTGWRYGMSWQDISVENDTLGKPEIKLSGKTLDYFQTMTGDDARIHLSLSHTREYAVAFVVIE